MNAKTVSFARAATFWIGRSSLSVSDQAMFAGANFVMTLFVARVLSPGEFGAFAISYAIFLFAHGLQTAVILEPASVLFSKHRPRCGTAVHTSSLFLNFVLSLGFAAALAVASAMSGEPISTGLTGAAIATVPFWCFCFFRRLAYTQNLPICANFGGAVYLAVIVLSLVILPAGRYTVLTGFHLVGLSSLAAAMALCLALHMTSAGRLFSLPSRRVLGAVSSLHVRHGKWNGPAATLGWFHSGVYLPVVGVFAGLEAAATLRILQLFITPLLQVYAALELWLLPRFVSIHTQSSRVTVRQLAVSVATICSFLAVAYILVLSLFGVHLADSFLGPQNKYSAHLWLTPYLLIILLARSAGTLPFGLILKSRGDFRRVFWATLTGTIISLTVGFYFTYAFELVGAIAGISITSVVIAIALTKSGQRYIAAESIR